MSERRESISAIDRLDPMARVKALQERTKAQEDARANGAAGPDDVPEARVDTYRVVIDPETLRAVTEVRDPETGDVRFVVPSTADYESDQRGFPAKPGED